MKYEFLGRTDLKLSVIGFGTWGISGDWGKEYSRKYASELFLRAYAMGINFFDTAAVYGNGFSEVALSGLRNAVIATKLPAIEKPQDNVRNFSYYYPKKHIVKYLSRSMNNLNRSKIDILLLHNWNPQWNKNSDVNLKYFACLKKSGKIRAFGVSLPNWMNSDIDELLDNQLVDCIEVPVNLFQQWAINKILRKAHECGIGILARSCLDHGSLANLMYKMDSLPDGDFRKKYFGGRRQSSVIRRVNRVINTLRIDKIQLPAYSINFVLKYATSAIIGIRNSSALADDVALVSKHFSEAQLKLGLGFRWDRSW